MKRVPSNQGKLAPSPSEEPEFWTMRPIPPSLTTANFDSGAILNSERPELQVIASSVTVPTMQMLLFPPTIQASDWISSAQNVASSAQDIQCLHSPQSTRSLPATGSTAVTSNAVSAPLPFFSTGSVSAPETQYKPTSFLTSTATTFVQAGSGISYQVTNVPNMMFAQTGSSTSYQDSNNAQGPSKRAAATVASAAARIPESSFVPRVTTGEKSHQITSSNSVMVHKGQEEEGGEGDSIVAQEVEDVNFEQDMTAFMNNFQF